MELQIARQIIDTLAQGINPITGEPMPEDSPYNAAPIIRALHAVSRALEDLQPAPMLQRKERPLNAGKQWTQQEDAALEIAFDAGISIKQVAAELGRSTYSIEARLVHLGKLAPAPGRFAKALR
jgi:hypothetical protein